VSRTIKKMRAFFAHPDTNQGKLHRLEALHAEYVIYVRICVQVMLDKRRLCLFQSEKQAFFPPSDKLTSQIVKNARDHAIQILSTWAKGAYVRRIQKTITNLRRDGEITDDQAKTLYTIGKYLRDRPKGTITQDDIDLYWTLLDERGGRKPEVRDTLPMRLSEMTSRLEDPEEAVLTDCFAWLRISSLTPRKSIWMPLVGNPYISQADQVGKGLLARKTPKGRWVFEAVEKREWIVLEPSDLPSDAPKLGVDVGLNVLAATSEGTLYGRGFKPKFDRAYQAVRCLRANRMRQNLRENSPRLDRLEQRLSGMIKTETGRIANDLIERHPDTVFILEDLDLRGCRGQKRFAYRALATALASKAPVEVVNPAYTSQECPSCGHVSRSNRSGIKFRCRSCGRLAHADWVGASGILRRSGDNDVGCADHPRTVKATLRRRFQARRARTSPARSSPAPSPLGRSLTTGASGIIQRIGTGSNLVPASPT